MRRDQVESNHLVSAAGDQTGTDTGGTFAQLRSYLTSRSYRATAARHAFYLLSAHNGHSVIASLKQFEFPATAGRGGGAEGGMRRAVGFYPHYVAPVTTVNLRPEIITIRSCQFCCSAMKDSK